MAFPSPATSSSARSCRHDPEGSLSPPCLVCVRKDRTPVQGPVSDNELDSFPPTTALPEAAIELELPSSDQKLARVLPAAAPDLPLRSPQVHSSYSRNYDCPQRSTIEEGGGTPQRITASTVKESLARNPRAADRMTSPGRGGVSPSSSPRLPSPPPFTEVQFGPKSPTIGDVPEYPFSSAAKPNDGPTRRIRPGTKAADMARGPPLVPLSELDSPFQLQEHLKALYCSCTQSPNLNTTTAITRETALQLANPPSTRDQSVDKALWLYELCRFLTMKANNVIVAFYNETPPCSKDTCPEMRASEWQYLCAVHDPPKSCSAIDYCVHTLDWAANVLTSPKYFPSRLMMNSEQVTGGGSGAGMRHLTNIFRRVYRIFAHAWFQHRDVFWHVEGSDGLYTFFKTVCDVYQLIPEDNYTIPVEAELFNNIEIETPVSRSKPDLSQLPVMKKTDENASAFAPEIYDPQEQQEAGEATITVSVGATTRRHKYTPSTGTNVATIAEGTEEEDMARGTSESTTQTTLEGAEAEAEAKVEPEPETEPQGRPRPISDAVPTRPGKMDLNGVTNFPEEASASVATPMPLDRDPMEAAGEQTVEETPGEHQDDDGEKEAQEEKKNEQVKEENETKGQSGTADSP